jgi:hypothetical protein
METEYDNDKVEMVICRRLLTKKTFAVSFSWGFNIPGIIVDCSLVTAIFKTSTGYILIWVNNEKGLNSEVFHAKTLTEVKKKRTLLKEKFVESSFELNEGVTFITLPFDTKNEYLQKISQEIMRLKNQHCDN